MGLTQEMVPINEIGRDQPKFPKFVSKLIIINGLNDFSDWKDPI